MQSPDMSIATSPVKPFKEALIGQLTCFDTKFLQQIPEELYIHGIITDDKNLTSSIGQHYGHILESLEVPLDKILQSSNASNAPMDLGTLDRPRDTDIAHFIASAQKKTRYIREKVRELPDTDFLLNYKSEEVTDATATTFLSGKLDHLIKHNNTHGFFFFALGLSEAKKTAIQVVPEARKSIESFEIDPVLYTAQYTRQCIDNTSS